jgi:hypothetical protein
MALKLRPTPKVNTALKDKVQKTPPKKSAPKEQTTEKSTPKKLPPDTYKDEIESIELPISDTATLVFSVKRQGDLGLPHVDIRTYVNTSTYVGFTKKGINFPLELLELFIETINEVDEACRTNHIE